MMQRILAMGSLVLMVALTGFYIKGNTQRIIQSVDGWQQVFDGEPSAIWALGLDGKVLVSRALPPTGVFDGMSLHQVNVESVPVAIYERLRSHVDRVTQVYNNVAQTSRLVDSGKYLATQIADRRVYLVREGDARTTALIYRGERRSARDVVICKGKQLCSDMKFNLTRGWSEPMGPFLNSDRVPSRRGLPRGRWVEGPQTTFSIQAKRAMRVQVDLMLLRLAASQRVRIQGPVVSQSLVMEGAPRRLGSRDMYPTRYRAIFSLKQGRNDFALKFSKWLPVAKRFSRGLAPGKRNGGLAGYAVKMVVTSPADKHRGMTGK